VLVVGAGVVGLAAAAALARRGRSVLVLERHAAIARETTSRNSEVIHAGLYYPEGSLKATLCVEGREALYARCASHGIPHRELGKLVVATAADELGALEALCARGTANGAPGLQLIDADAVRAREPAVEAVAGLLSPRTGIVDAHALTLSYAAEAEAGGASVLLRNRVVDIGPRGDRYTVVAEDAEGERSEVACAAVVNAAGLEADRIAALVGLDVDAIGYRIHPCKGDYFSLAPGAPYEFNGLVYPLHGAAGLGVHVTLDLAGRVRLGPDTEYVAAPHYAIDAGKGARFAEAAGRYLPGLRAEWLSPDYAGVRPKLAGPGEPFRDFVVQEESARGLPGFVNLVGIESPGLTAAGAIADMVAQLI